MVSNVGLVIPENSRRALGDSPLTVRDPLLPIGLMVLAFSTEDDTTRSTCDSEKDVLGKQTSEVSHGMIRLLSKVRRL